MHIEVKWLTFNHLRVRSILVRQLPVFAAASINFIPHVIARVGMTTCAIYCRKMEVNELQGPTFADVSINGMSTSHELQYSKTLSLAISRSSSKS